MYVIKHLPEDFVVSEVSSVKPKTSGKFLYFRLWKRDVATLDALRRLSIAWRVPMSALSCAGNKDKAAITEQTCSVCGVARERVEQMNKDIKCTFLGYGDEPVHLGQLDGNRFKIIIRNLDVLPKISSRFRNLFGEQRFSVSNADVGRHIVKRRFREAVDLIVNLYPGMKLQGTDYVGVLRRLPRRLLLFFVHAYQSLLWNKAALLSDADVLPVVGFGTEVFDETTSRILAEEDLMPSDFVVRELPEVSAEGSDRFVWAEAKDLKIGSLENDECFPGKKVQLDFFLPKGCYATEFLRQVFQ